MKETSFVCIGSSEKDCSLKDPVELPRSPVGVNVPDYILYFAILLFFGVIYLINRSKAKEEDVNEVR
jgi:hypothetical protein